MEGFNNMQEPLRTQDELQNLQIPGKNSPQEVDLLRKQMLNESLSEQIKDLKEGDEITVRTVNSIWDPSIQDNQDYVHYHNMFFAYADKNDKGDVFLRQLFQLKKWKI